jgi:hypothetical protein
MVKNKKTSSALPTMKRPTSLPTGPRWAKPPRDKGFRGSAAVAPDGFVHGSTSLTEWMIYHAFSKIFGVPQDPRIPPFYGYPGVWAYQKAAIGGRHEPGGAVVDFIVYPGAKSRGRLLAFRIQTEYFHNYADSEKQASDLLQSWALSEYYAVFDIYDYQFVNDKTNQSAIILIKRCLNGETFSPPGATGNVQRVRS